MPVELTSTSTRPKRSTASPRSMGRSRRRDLAGVDRDALARRVELVPGGRELGLTRAAEQHARALVEEAPRCGLADPAAAAGDQDDLVLVLPHGRTSVGR